MNKKEFYIYILTNKRITVLYTGITSNLIGRIYQYREKQVKGFTEKYNLDRLVYFEKFDDPENAIKCEKQIKGWKREKKIKLIKSENSTFKDLYNDIL